MRKWYIPIYGVLLAAALGATSYSPAVAEQSCNTASMMVEMVRDEVPGAAVSAYVTDPAEVADFEVMYNATPPVTQRLTGTEQVIVFVSPSKPNALIMFFDAHNCYTGWLAVPVGRSQDSPAGREV